MGSSASAQIYPMDRDISIVRMCNCDKFARIDRFVIEQCKDVKLKSLNELVTKLRAGANGQVDTLRSFYTWITHNIRLSDEKITSDPLTILQTLQADSNGMSLLFSLMCKDANITCRQICGHLKNAKGMRGKHYWTHVFLDNSWKIIDCACGAEILHKDGQCIRRPSGFYFMTKPVHFIAHHFPDDNEQRNLQLLEEPLHLSSFQRSVLLSDEAMSCDVTVTSHKNKDIVMEKEVEITVKDKHCNLTAFDVILSCSSFDIGDLKSYTFVKMEDKGIFTVKIRPPLVGKYDVILTGRLRGNNEPEIEIVRYTLVCEKVLPNAQPFPIWRPLWGVYPHVSKFGFEDKTKFHAQMVVESGDVEYKIPTNLGFTSTKVEVKPRLRSCFTGYDEFIRAIAEDEFVTIMARFPEPGFYCLELFCKTENDVHFHPVLSFFIECKHALKNCKKFQLAEREVWV